jgi:uncharacterized protein YdaU (DUF1376 family)
MAMTLEQEAIYNRLMDICWLERSIPADPELLRPLVKGGSTNDIAVVLLRFNPAPQNASQLVHPRLEKERAKQKEWSEKSRLGGLKSGEARRKNQQNSKPARQRRVVQAPSNRTVDDSLNTSFASSSSKGATTLTTFGESAAAPNAPATPQRYENKWRNLKGSRRDREVGKVGNGAKLVAARARTQGYEARKPHPMLNNDLPKQVDQRTGRFKDEISRWYAEVNETDISAVPWGLLEDKALAAMLNASNIRIGDLQKCLKHRAESVGAGEYSSSAMPASWLRKLPGFLAVPLNRYGDPLLSKRKP